MRRRQKRRFIRIGALAAILAGCAALALASRSSAPGCTVVRGSGTLEINVRHLAPGTAKVFCYSDSAGKRLRFLLARSRRGKVYASFDACRECYTNHKGYSVHDGYLECRMCGTRYRIDNMLKGKASCVPVKLPMTRHGSTVDIKVGALEKGQWLF